jgi:hypothetical protein
MNSTRSKSIQLAGVVLAAAVAGSVAMPSASASASPRTKSQARTITKHINVRHLDFPGYKVHPYQSSKGAKTTEQNFHNCVGLAPVFAERHSDSYDDGHGAIYSSVTEFVSSRKVAKHDSALAGSAQGRDCLKQELMSIAAAVGSKDTQVTVTPVTETPVDGVDAIYAAKWSATYSVYGFKGTLYGWAIGFSRGNVEATLSEIGTANVPASKLDAPLATVIERAKRQVPTNGLPVAHG